MISHSVHEKSLSPSVVLPTFRRGGTKSFHFLFVLLAIWLLCCKLAKNYKILASTLQGLNFYLVLQYYIYTMCNNCIKIISSLQIRDQSFIFCYWTSSWTELRFWFSFYFLKTLYICSWSVYWKNSLERCFVVLRNSFTPFLLGLLNNILMFHNTFFMLNGALHVVNPFTPKSFPIDE